MVRVLIFSIIIAPVHRSSISVMPFTSKYPYISSPERGVTESITHWVYGTIDVAQIIEKVPKTLRNTICTSCDGF